MLVLLLGDSLLSLEKSLSSLVELQLSDLAVGGLNGDLTLLAYLTAETKTIRQVRHVVEV